MNKEKQRLSDFQQGKANWRKWGTYLSERQWGTVREDYSPNGTAWDYFPHDHARSRAYRWGEDGIAGWSDDQQHFCFAPAFWNGKDPILKERLFGLNAAEGNHGEDVKELYYYLDNTPTHSYAKYLYKYPQQEYPYEQLLEENRNRSRQSPEFELLDSGIFADNEYFNIYVEYAKANEEATCIHLTIENVGSKRTDIYVLPTFWFRNTWDFGLGTKPEIRLKNLAKEYLVLTAQKEEWGKYFIYMETPEKLLFTENETNRERLFGVPNASARVKDSFHTSVIDNDFSTVENPTAGTKAAPLYKISLDSKARVSIRLFISNKEHKGNPLKQFFTNTFAARKSEADQFYHSLLPGTVNPQEKLIFRQALSGLLWNKQFYNYKVKPWLSGDPGQPQPPAERQWGRNSNWQHLSASDIISMPDSWEFPWFAAWDSAFQMVSMVLVDPHFAKEQLLLFAQDRYQRADGAMPAYEWNFSDLNPPLRAWAALKVYAIDQSKDFDFLEKISVGLRRNYNWWQKNEDAGGDDIFSGGFLGLDNISLFNRSEVLNGEKLEQADATSWMAVFAIHLMKICLHLSEKDKSYELLAINYFNDFVEITNAINQFGNQPTGLWNEEEGFFFDCLKTPDGAVLPLPVKSVVGLTTLFPVCFLSGDLLQKNERFHQHLIKCKQRLTEDHLSCAIEGINDKGGTLISLIHIDRLTRILQTVFDVSQFLSAYGIRSLSKNYEEAFCMMINGHELCIQYQPGESQSGLFGGNSNWRGSIWMPINFMLVQSLLEYSLYYKNTLRIAFPSGSGEEISLGAAANKLMKMVLSIFLKDDDGERPVHGKQAFYKKPENENLILFYEYFHGNNGRGCGASHQTGWSALIAAIIKRLNIQN